MKKQTNKDHPFFDLYHYFIIQCLITLNNFGFVIILLQSIENRSIRKIINTIIHRYYRLIRRKIISWTLITLITWI